MAPPNPGLATQREARRAHRTSVSGHGYACSGRLCPELGGHESSLGIMGFNYYYDNQWQLPRTTTWAGTTPQWTRAGCP
ncbi:MAG: hypothetical protein WKG07_38545 [Hymenobacter sp.]